MRLDNKSENLKYDEDSNKESWENYYIPYYKDILGDEVDLDLEGLHRYQSGTVLRVVAEVKKEYLKEYLSGGLKKFNGQVM